MKNAILFLLVIFSFTLLSSCDNSDKVEYGRLKVKVIYEGEIVQNAAVAIAKSQKDLDLGIYIDEVFTDINGYASFGALDPCTYYFDSYKRINNNQTFLYASDIINVQAGHKHDVTLNLVIKK